MARASSGACSSRASIRSRSPKSEVRDSSALTGSWVVGSPAAVRISWRRPGDIPAVASARDGPRPVGEGRDADGASSSRAVRTRRSRSSPPQTIARSRSRPSARGSSSSPPGSRAASSPYGQGSGATASASATWRAKRSSRSSARSTEVRAPARVASWERSPGTGESRSGRARSRAASASSGRERSSSASVRGAARRSAAGSVVIRPTVPAACGQPVPRADGEGTVVAYGCQGPVAAEVSGGD